MTISAEIAPFLPLLRRHSMALTGSQAVGDAVIVTMLEALIAEIGIFPSTSSARISLYTLHWKFYSSALHRVPTWFAPTTVSREFNLMALAPRHRQALLLVTLDNFSRLEAAETLGVPEEEFGHLLTASYAELASWDEDISALAAVA
ncbi:hypothetical protein [Mesorhizobium sp.]|uniref:hypothetical protein n=1 Tax=Mesorhizobium sp. TaxID=1871066 RepID=UPI000FE53E72|nr:hypothetical protein [Mesorhizobium sp.]RWO32353.1 MAG: hypothetical protein EOS10_11695 [Mesorhizobium sp.]TIN24020.1 MAG: hypothetical protein E5Y19_24130 [Mesorhizobium sp.]